MAIDTDTDSFVNEIGLFSAHDVPRPDNYTICATVLHLYDVCCICSRGYILHNNSCYRRERIGSRYSVALYYSLSFMIDLGFKLRSSITDFLTRIDLMVSPTCIFIQYTFLCLLK